ncbi:MAG: hypothetical protein ACK4TA_24650, partial [Saprospiraceae bacterium]
MLKNYAYPDMNVTPFLLPRCVILAARSVVLILFSVFLLFTTYPDLQAQPCASDLYLQQRLAAQPHLVVQRQQLEAFTQRWIAENAERIASRAVITIPVVVHVVWREVSENISDERIQAQLEVLNRDYRAKNIEINTVPAIFRPAI